MESKDLCPHRLPDQEGVRALLDQEHRGGVLQDVGVLQRLAQASLPRDLAVNLEDRDPVQLDAFLRVENVVAGIRLANG